MLIIDSGIQFFSLWRGAGEPLSFLNQSSANRDDISVTPDFKNLPQQRKQLVRAQTHMRGSGWTTS